MKNLEVDETLGQLLVAEGFSTIDFIKDCKLSDLIKKLINSFPFL